MRNFQDTFETHKQSFIGAFSICMTVPLRVKTNLPINYHRYYTVRLTWSNLLNQINLIMYTAKFETFLSDQIFTKIGRILNHQTNLMKIIQSKLKNIRKNQENKTTN